MQRKKDLGYPQELMVLPFDHRNSFQEKLFGIHGQPSPEETALISSYKTVIYDGFERAVQMRLPKEKMGVLVDEQFGLEVIQRARKAGFTLCICVEKSGQDEFDFEYGENFEKHIDACNPDLVKVLVRYNPQGDQAMNQRQAKRLKQLSDYLAKTQRKFMFELLVPATDAQMQACNMDKNTYELEYRPKLMVQAMKELQDTGIEVDVWKLEGLDRKEDFQKVCAQAKAEGREEVGCILLGRGENADKVRSWLAVGANVPGVIGFAVGRTVFWEPLKKLREGKQTTAQAAEEIAQNYSTLCKLWLELRQRKTV